MAPWLCGTLNKMTRSQFCVFVGVWGPASPGSPSARSPAQPSQRPSWLKQEVLGFGVRRPRPGKPEPAWPLFTTLTGSAGFLGPIAEASGGGSRGWQDSCIPHAAALGPRRICWRSSGPSGHTTCHHFCFCVSLGLGLQGVSPGVLWPCCQDSQQGCGVMTSWGVLLGSVGGGVWTMPRPHPFLPTPPCSSCPPPPGGASKF